jgi:hypothetical protein
LRQGIINQFTSILQSRGLNNDKRLYDRLQIFCFKYDLEALLLAAKDSLAEMLQLENLEVTWTIPVEDQNHNHPPRFFVEQLFRNQGQKYKGSIDAPLILGNASLQSLIKACPQQFAPFVNFLQNLQPPS